MCRKSVYGNCDEETKDDEYCIFHKPDKSEEEVREFWRKFLERFKPVREKIKVEILIGEIEVERFVFKGDVYCSGYIFPEIPKDINFSFKYAVFENEAWFVDVTFKTNMDFTGAEFKNKAEFTGAIFKGVVWFENTIFKGDAEFLVVKFEDIANFTDNEPEKENCKPEEKRYRFYGKLNFSSITFKTINIDLPSECFKHPQAEAEACRIQRISYEREGRKDDADRMFIRERRALRRLKVLEAKEKLKESKDLKSKIIAAGKILKAYAGSAVEFALADLTCKYGTEWIRALVLWLLAVIGLFPLLYLVTGIENSKYKMVSICASNAGMILILTFLAIFSLILFVNAYQDKHRILSKVTLVTLISAAIFTLLAILQYYAAIHNYATTINIKSYLECIYFSVVTATTLGYGDLHPIGWGKAIASAEAIFGMFMWAVFLAVFSRKYMR